MYDAYHLISTPENVDLRLELAGLGNRILACFIDTLFTYLAIALVWIIFGIALLAFNRIGTHYHFDFASKTMTVLVIFITALNIILSFIINFGYFIFFEGRWQGQTPGKKIVGLRVVSDNGAPVSWQAVLLRNVLRMFDEGFFLIGIIFMIVEKDEKRIGDLASGVVVIRERKAAKLQLNALANQNTNTDEFASNLAAELSPTDYEILDSFLRRRQYMLKKQRADLAQKLAKYFSTKLNNSLPVTTNAELYLEQIIR